MPRQAKSREEIIRRKQERERGYRLNSEALAKKREQDRVYQQRKREESRVRHDLDRLAQLADVTTQREYLENNMSFEGMMVEGEEMIDVSGMVEEEGEVLENWVTGEWEEGYDDGFGEGVAEEFDMNEKGMKCMKMSNGRGECQGRRGERGTCVY
jgi:hypothetical protein